MKRFSVQIGKLRSDVGKEIEPPFSSCAEDEPATATSPTAMVQIPQ